MDYQKSATRYFFLLQTVATIIFITGALSAPTQQAPPDHIDFGIKKTISGPQLAISVDPLSDINNDVKPKLSPKEELDDGEQEGGDRKSRWTYTDQKGWAQQYPTCKGVKLRQSPIDIMTDAVIFKPNMRMELIDYDQKVEFQFKNTHHSVSLTVIPSVSNPTIRANWVPDGQDFELQEIHFHWGDGINKGSEHEINNEKAAAEMHMVHYRKGIDKESIGTTENSVLVLGVMIESDSIEHNKLDALVKNSEKINGTDTECMSDEPENLVNLLPESHHSFYTYNGSLTTPPCYEVVTWVIMSEPVYMSQEKLVELSNLESADPKFGRQRILNNHRDIQPLLDRPVYVSFNVSDSITPNSAYLKQPNNTNAINMALGQYWETIHSIKGSVLEAFDKINEARKKLLRSIGLV